MSVGNWEEKQRVDHLEVGGKKGKRVRCNLNLTCQDIRIIWWWRWNIGVAASQSTRRYWQSKGGRPFLRNCSSPGLPAMTRAYGSGVSVKPGSGRERPAKSNRDAFLTDSERTGVNGEIVGLGCRLAQRVPSVRPFTKSPQC